MPSTIRAVDNQHEMRRVVADPLPNATTRAALFDVGISDASFRRDVHTKCSCPDVSEALWKWHGPTHHLGRHIAFNQRVDGGGDNPFRGWGERLV